MSKVRSDIDSSQQETDLDPQQQQPGDDQEHADITEKDGKTEVRFSGESKRDRRLREIREERQRELDTAISPLKESLATTQRQLQEALNRLAAPQHAQRQQAPASDDLDDEYLQVAEKQEALLVKIRAGGYSPEQGEKFKREYYKLDRQRAAIAARPVASEAISKYRPPQGPSAYEQQLAAEHPDVWFNEGARAYALNYATMKQQELEAQGKKPTPGEVKRLHHEALTRAGEVYGYRRPATPASEGQKQRFAGMSSSGKKAGSPITRQLTDVEKELAVSGAPAGMSTADAYVRFARLMQDSEAG